MRYLVTGGQMKEIDRHATEVIGIPSLVLMEQAAMAVVSEVLKRAEKHDRIWAVCGSGNNGADGIAAARLLYLQGYGVTVILAGSPENGTPEYKKQIEIARNLGMELFEYGDFIPGRCEIMIDAIFGVGLSREVEGTCRDLIAALLECEPACVVAVDLPSGIHADTGQVMGIALKADVTVSFGYEKLGTMLYPGRSFSKRVVVADIGFPGMDPQGRDFGLFTLEQGDLSMIPSRPAYSNKGTFGRVLLVAGSANMGGAAYLSGLAAYKTGAGLVKLFTVEENRVILQTALPEAVLAVYDPDEAKEACDHFMELVKEECQWADVIVLGPGIGHEPYIRNLVEGVLANAYVPIILDADGLNAVAAHPELAGYFTENIIVTPHLGEMARLTGRTVEEIREGLIPAAREYADRYGITCILKDAVTVAALKDQRTFVNDSGNSAMAKAGAGDVLTGILAGLLALGMGEADAAAMGVYIHGRAGDLVKRRVGQHGLLARELAQAIGSVMGEKNWKEVREDAAIREDL